VALKVLPEEFAKDSIGCQLLAPKIMGRTGVEVLSKVLPEYFAVCRLRG